MPPPEDSLTRKHFMSEHVVRESVSMSHSPRDRDYSQKRYVLIGVPLSSMAPIGRGGGEAPLSANPTTQYRAEMGAIPALSHHE